MDLADAQENLFKCTDIKTHNRCVHARIMLPYVQKTRTRYDSPLYLYSWFRFFFHDGAASTLTLPETGGTTQTRGKPPKPSWTPRSKGTSFPSTAPIACRLAREEPRVPSPSTSTCQLPPPPLPPWPISAAVSPWACCRPSCLRRRQHHR